MAELYELSCCPSGLASESKLSRRPKEHHGFVPNLSHHSGKIIKNCPLVKQIYISNNIGDGTEGVL